MKAWIRKLLGIDEILTKQAQYYTNYVDRNLTDIRTELRNRYEKLMEAGAELEAAVDQLDTSTASLHRTNSERLDAIRAFVRTNESETRKLAGELIAARAIATGISNRVEKIEFPGFEPIVKN